MSNELFLTTVDGQWGPWRGWSDCSQTCGGGTRNRTRLCNNPRPEFGGLDCAGDETEIEECSSQGCPGMYAQGNPALDGDTVCF